MKFVLFFIKQIKQLNSYNRELFIYKISKLFFYILCLCLCIIYFPVFIFIRLIHKFYLIRFGELSSNRIGHFALETDLYLSNKKNTNLSINSSYISDLFCLNIDSKNICNKKLLELFAQNLKIFNKFIIFPFILLNKSIFGHSRHLILLTQFDKSNLLTKSPNNLSFCNEDLEIGNNFFKKVFKENINQKFVLLIIRDPAYLNSLFNKNWSYHDSRNINLHNIVEACSVLTSLGYYIFRMGSLVEEKINSSDPKIIDYATNGMRTDFLDVFLSANCSFAVSSGTGLDLVPMLFRKPVLTLSYVQIGQFHLSKTMNYSMISFRNFYSSILRRNLDLTEIFKLGLQKIDADLLVKNSIILKESSVEENKKIILEMTNFVENKKFDFISNNNLAFRKNMNELYKSFNSSNALEENFNIKISDVFLNNNKNFLR